MAELTSTVAKAHQDYLDLHARAQAAMEVRDGALRELYGSHGVPVAQIQQMVPAGPGYERLRQIVRPRR